MIDGPSIADAPAWLLDLVTKPREESESTDPNDGDTSTDSFVTEGRRSAYLTSLAGSMRRRGMKPVAIFAALKEENNAVCRPPLTVDEVRAIAKSVARYKPSAPASGHVKTLHLHHTDAGNAKRLVAHYGVNIHYCHQWKAWLVWDGQRWVRDVTGEIVQIAKLTIRALISEIMQGSDGKERLLLLRFAMQSESVERLKAMITLAQSEPGIPIIPLELDANPWLLNCLNGTLNLKKGTLRPHIREDLITKIAPVSYDPNARLPEWDRFLSETTGGDADLEGFLRRSAGYSITGDTSEEKLFFVQGDGATGKSTFLNSLKAALGDYALTADFEAFVARQFGGGPRNDIARLAGARCVISIEVDEGKKLAEGLVKMLTGGDTVSARFLYAEFFEFKPAFKLWLAANYAPQVRDDDAAMWRRILRVPFDHVVPEKKRDPKLKALLQNPSLAGPAILAWAVRGCVEWQKQGLGVPVAVELATAAFRNEMDPLTEFIGDRCVLDPNAWCFSRSLWLVYSMWCDEVGEKWPLDRKRFGERLKTRGCHPVFRDRSRAWTGIGIARQNTESPKAAETPNNARSPE